jgi:hypothetical protein
MLEIREGYRWFHNPSTMEATLARSLGILGPGWIEGRGPVSPHKNNLRPVCCVETGKVFDSPNAAAKKYSRSVFYCLTQGKGRQKRARKLSFEFLEEDLSGEV